MLTSDGWCEKKKTPEENTRQADRRSEAAPLARIGSDIAGHSAKYRKRLTFPIGAQLQN